MNIIFVMLFSNLATAAPHPRLALTKSYKIQSGVVQELSDDKLGYELRHKRKTIFKYEGPRIGDLPTVAFQKKWNGLDLLIVDSYGGDPCPHLYELIAIGKDGKSTKSEFGNCAELDEKKITISNNEIRFDFESHAFRGEPDNATSYVFDGKKIRQKP